MSWVVDTLHRSFAQTLIFLWKCGICVWIPNLKNQYWVEVAERAQREYLVRNSLLMQCHASFGPLWFRRSLDFLFQIWLQYRYLSSIFVKILLCSFILFVPAYFFAISRITLPVIDKFPTVLPIGKSKFADSNVNVNSDIFSENVTFPLQSVQAKNVQNQSKIGKSSETNVHKKSISNLHQLYRQEVLKFEKTFATENQIIGSSYLVFNVLFESPNKTMLSPIKLKIEYTYKDFPYYSEIRRQQIFEFLEIGTWKKFNLKVEKIPLSVSISFESQIEGVLFVSEIEYRQEALLSNKLSQKIFVQLSGLSKDHFSDFSNTILKNSAHSQIEFMQSKQMRNSLAQESSKMHANSQRFEVHPFASQASLAGYTIESNSSESSTTEVAPLTKFVTRQSKFELREMFNVCKQLINLNFRSNYQIEIMLSTLFSNFKPPFEDINLKDYLFSFIGGNSERTLQKSLLQALSREVSELNNFTQSFNQTFRPTIVLANSENEFH